MMLGYAEKLEKLVKAKNGLKIHSLHFVRSEVLKQTTNEQLKSIGLGAYEAVFFDVLGDSYVKNGALNPEHSNLINLAGATINILSDSFPQQVILIQNEFPNE
ncbi:MAG: hypothetical protein F6K31_43885, partial [Symploca sp. SIO2G7]|nr:hypothetical protein [Symploca sp. SIO2G7]